MSQKDRNTSVCVLVRYNELKLNCGLQGRSLCRVKLVSTTSSFCTNLRTALFRAKKVNAYDLQVHLCENVQQLLDSAEIQVQVDFIVFGPDIRKINCVEQIKENLALLNRTFMPLGDYCMVISSKVPCYEMGVSWDNLKELQATYQMMSINGDTEDEDKCNHLGDQILRWIETAKGINTGLPFITLTYDVHEEENIFF